MLATPAWSTVTEQRKISSFEISNSAFYPFCPIISSFYSKFAGNSIQASQLAVSQAMSRTADVQMRRMLLKPLLEPVLSTVHHSAGGLLFALMLLHTSWTRRRLILGHFILWRDLTRSSD